LRDRAGISRRCERIALFVGSYHPPNLAAADFIVGIASVLPETLYVIAGGLTPHFAGRDLPANVLLTGRVSDAVLASLLASGDVALNPMTSGGGSNLKMIEYFAAGIPVVSTELGARGIDAVAGQDVLVSDLPNFPANIAATLATPEDSHKRVLSARGLAEIHYDWPMLAERFGSAITAVMAR
jgi:glycosyltransferase involved in cell wall biosynthesis